MRAMKVLLASGFWLLASGAAAAPPPNILQDGTFLNPIGSGSNLTPWSDWTNAGVTRLDAPGSIPGNYARLSWGTDLFQRFLAPAPGVYTLSFFAQNPMSYSAKMIIDLQPPLGGNWGLLGKVIDLAPSANFSLFSYTINWNRTQGEPSEFYFSNSYNFPDPARGFQDTVNPPGTFLNVADVRFALQIPSSVPDQPTWLTLITGFSVVGAAMRRRASRSFAS